MSTLKGIKVPDFLLTAVEEGAKMAHLDKDTNCDVSVKSIQADKYNNIIRINSIVSINRCEYAVVTDVEIDLLKDSKSKNKVSKNVSESVKDDILTVIKQLPPADLEDIQENITNQSEVVNLDNTIEPANPIPPTQEEMMEKLREHPEFKNIINLDDYDNSKDADFEKDDSSKNADVKLYFFSGDNEIKALTMNEIKPMLYSTLNDSAEILAPYNVYAGSVSEKVRISKDDFNHSIICTDGFIETHESSIALFNFKCIVLFDKRADSRLGRSIQILINNSTTKNDVLNAVNEMYHRKNSNINTYSGYMYNSAPSELLQ